MKIENSNPTIPHLGSKPRVWSLGGVVAAGAVFMLSMFAGTASFAQTCQAQCVATLQSCHGGCGTNGSCHSACDAAYPGCIAACPTPTAPPTPGPTVPPTPTPAPGNRDPIGNHDTLTCSVAEGWTCDSDNFNQPLQVHFYKDGPAGGGGQFVGVATANRVREAGVAALCGNNAAHGFSFAIPQSLKDGASHTLHAYAINIRSNGVVAGVNPLLGGSPKTVLCPLSEVLAKPGPRQCGLIYQPVTFDGSASLSTANPARPITSYSWDFGDSFFGSGIQAGHAYGLTGLYNVGLRVGDDLGRVSDQAFTTARIYSAAGNALSVTQPILQYREVSGLFFAQASARIPAACANWQPIIQVVVEEKSQGVWQVLIATPKILGIWTDGTPGFEFLFGPRPFATDWRMRVYYFVQSGGTYMPAGYLDAQ